MPCSKLVVCVLLCSCYISVKLEESVPCDRISSAFCTSAKIAQACPAVCGQPEEDKKDAGKSKEKSKDKSKGIEKEKNKDKSKKKSKEEVSDTNLNEHGVGDEEAAYRFRSCCEAVIPGCADICKYEVTITEVQETVNTGECPLLTYISKYLWCASDNNDNTDCCRQKGLDEKGKKKGACMQLCEPTGPKQLWLEHKPCFLEIFDTVLVCHREGLRSDKV